MDKRNITQNVLFFLSRAPTHHCFNFNLRFFYGLKHKVHLSKTVKRKSHFQFWIPFRLCWSLYFSSAKCMDSLTLKCYNSFRNYINRKAIYSFASRHRIFKLQQKFLKFSDIETGYKLFQLENRSSENMSIVTFK